MATKRLGETENEEQCPHCKSIVPAWMRLPPGSNEPGGQCDKCRPKIVIPAWAYSGPCTGFTI